MEFSGRILKVVVCLCLLAGLWLLLVIAGDSSKDNPQPEIMDQSTAARETATAARKHPNPKDTDTVSLSSNHGAIAYPILEDLMRWDFNGLEITTDADGMQVMHLNGRFTHVSAAVRDKQGVMRIQCFSGHQAMQAAIDASAPVLGTVKGRSADDVN